MTRRILNLCLGAMILLGGARAGFYLAYAAFRIPCPKGEIWHLEEKMVHLAWRVQAGEVLYPEWRDYPHVSNFYGPCYFLAVGLIGRATGADLAELTRIGRVVTFGCGLLATLVVGLHLGRRLGLGAGAVGSVLTLGAAPMYGFSAMVRSDLMAEALGILGFFLATGGSTRRRVAGGGVLVLAALTKQTAATFLLAAAVAWLLRGRGRVAAALLVGGLAALGAVVAAVTAGIEPRFAESLLGEAGNPPDLANWVRVLGNVGRRAPDLFAFTAIGLGLWLAARPREVAPVALAAVIVTAGLATAVKRGSDVNYFLDVRLVEGLAAGRLWQFARSRRARPPSALLAAAALGAASLVPGTLDAAHEALEARRLAASVDEPIGRSVARVTDEVIRLARDPGFRLLTDQPLFDLHQGERAAFLDPFLFRMLVDTGRIRPTRMARALRAEAYDLIVVSAPLDDPHYLRYPFGLPAILIEAARRHYVPIGWRAGYFFYAPRGAPRRPGLF